MRQKKKIFKIYFEGKSDKIYFEALRSLDIFRNSNYKLDLEDLKGQGNLLKKLNSGEIYKNFEKIAFIFDKDNLNSNEINPHESYIIGFSNPKFEVWLLAHYTKKIKDAYLNNTTLLDKDLDRYIPNYKKADPRISDLAKTYEIAIGNIQGKNELDFEKVCTTVDNVIKEILKEEE